MIHTVKDFNVVNEAEVDVFLEFSSFFSDTVDVCNLISCPLPSLIQLEHLEVQDVHVLLKLSLENFEHYFARCEMNVLTCRVHHAKCQAG